MKTLVFVLAAFLAAACSGDWSRPALMLGRMTAAGFVTLLLCLTLGIDNDRPSS